jgi:hypothetical protein
MSTEYIVSELAFYRGSLVNKGQRITIEDGEDVPAWCVQDVTKVKEDKPRKGDVRPADAAKAAAEKHGALADAKV